MSSSGSSAPVARSRTRSVYRSPPSSRSTRRAGGGPATTITAWTSKKSWPSASTLQSSMTVSAALSMESATAVHGVRQPFDGAGDVPPRTVADGHREVGLLHPGRISWKIVSTSSSWSANHDRGVGVLGLQVGDRVGVLAVGEPGPRVVGGPGRALPRVGLGRGGRGTGFGHGSTFSRFGHRIVPRPRFRDQAGTGCGPLRFVASMRVWIDQDLCTGDGLCVDHCPDVFTQLEDGIAYVDRGRAPAQRPRWSRFPRPGPRPPRPVRDPRRRGVPRRVHLHRARPAVPTLTSTSPSTGASPPGSTCAATSPEAAAAGDGARAG